MVQRAVTQVRKDSSTVGTVAEGGISLPTKSIIRKFGIISAGSDVVCSTGSIFELRTSNGTKLATFKPGSAVLGSWEATGAAPETATTIGANRGMVVCVGTNPGVSGSVYYFVDYTADFEG